MGLKKLLAFQKDLIRFHESGQIRLEPESHRKFNLAAAEVNGQINVAISALKL